MSSEAHRLLSEKELPSYYEPLSSKICTISPEHQNAMWWQVMNPRKCGI
jgi:hypothetical protein